MVNKRAIAGEAAVASAAILGSVPGGGLLVTALAGALGIATTYFAELGETRRQELFDNQKLVDHVLTRIQESTDFAALTYDIWRRYTLESSAERRKMLKTALENEAYSGECKFDNTSRFEYVIQYGSLKMIKLVKLVYSNTVQRDDRPLYDGESKPSLLGYSKLNGVLIDMGYEYSHDEIELYSNEAAAMGLIVVVHGTMGGPFIKTCDFGREFIKEISESEYLIDGKE